MTIASPICRLAALKSLRPFVLLFKAFKEIVEQLSTTCPLDLGNVPGQSAQSIIVEQAFVPVVAAVIWTGPATHKD